MASKEIANEDRIILITPNSAGVPGPAVGMSYTETPASKAKANSKFVLVNQISLTAAGCTIPAHTFVSGASVAPIMATATKCKCDNLFVLRKGDSGTCVGGFTLTAAPFTPQACTCKYEIQDAGQIKAKGE